MKFHTPNLVVGTLQPPQTELRPKFGGLSWGFPTGKWPVCGECHHPMALLAQLPHEAPMLDLGNPERVLHLFQCTNWDYPCATWDSKTGANAALILEKSELGHGLVQMQGNDRLIGEAWITGWQEQEDAVPPDLAPSYNETFDELPDDLRFPKGFVSFWNTKAGGLPYWTANGPMGCPSPPFEYLLQIDTFLSFSGPLPDATKAGCRTRVNHPDGTSVENSPEILLLNAPEMLQQEWNEPDRYYGDIANFGSDGTAYVYIDRQSSPLKALWFWNR